MSELKVYHCNEWHNEYTEFYLKSEADKVIEELKEQNHELCQALHAMYSKEEMNYQKHKRCLDKAEMCKARYDAEDARVNGHGASWDYTSDEMKYWERWQKRWLELAEKFKDKEVTNAVDKSNA